MLGKALSFTVGAIAGVLLWWYVTPAYNAGLAEFAGVLRVVDGRFYPARFVPVGRTIECVRREASNFPSIALPVDQLTYNIILLFGLFATAGRPFGDRNITRFLMSLAIVAAMHCVAVLLLIEGTYANSFSAWSEQHYGTVARLVWPFLSFAYRLIGMFAIVFACWWWSISVQLRSDGRTR